MRKAVVVVMFNDQNQILSLKRVDDHKYPGQRCFPGGKTDYITEEVKVGNDTRHIGRWEEYEEAAFREVLEETGIHITMFAPMEQVFLADENFMVKTFMARELEGMDFAVTKEFPNREHDSYQWLDIGDIPDDCGKMTAILLRTIAQNIQIPN